MCLYIVVCMSSLRGKSRNYRVTVRQLKSEGRKKLLVWSQLQWMQCTQSLGCDRLPVFFPFLRFLPTVNVLHERITRIHPLIDWHAPSRWQPSPPYLFFFPHLFLSVVLLHEQVIFSEDLVHMKKAKKVKRPARIALLEYKSYKGKVLSTKRDCVQRLTEFDLQFLCGFCSDFCRLYSIYTVSICVIFPRRILGQISIKLIAFVLIYQMLCFSNILVIENR